MKELAFADAWLFWVLVPLYLLWVVAWLLRGVLARRRPAGALRYSSIGPLRRLHGSRTIVARRAVEGLRLLTVGLLVLAMARPQTGRATTQVRTEGIDIVLALDTSGSMQALDLDADRQIARRRNRLEVAKEVVEKFVEQRDSDQIGLVVFGERAFTQCPLTLDHGILATFLERCEVGMAGDATAIGDALGVAIKRLRDSPAKSKVVVLITDGVNNAGVVGPRQAAEVARALGIKVYTIGAAARGQAPFLVDTIFGKQVIYQDVELDEELLREVATTTGGAFYRAEDAEALAAIYRQIDELEKTEITTHQYMEYNERFRWFVIPAVGLLLGEVLLLGTRFRKLP